MICGSWICASSSSTGPRSSFDPFPTVAGAGERQPCGRANAALGHAAGEVLDHTYTQHAYTRIPTFHSDSRGADVFCEGGRGDKYGRPGEGGLVFGGGEEDALSFINSPRATPCRKRGLRTAIRRIAILSLPSADARQKAAKKTCFGDGNVAEFSARRRGGNHAICICDGVLCRPREWERSGLNAPSFGVPLCGTNAAAQRFRELLKGTLFGSLLTLRARKLLGRRLYRRYGNIPSAQREGFERPEKLPLGCFSARSGPEGPGCWP